jgi:hypothetical protein
MVAIELLAKGRDFDPMKRLLICLIVAAAAFGQTRTASCNGTQQYIVWLNDSDFARPDAEALPGLKKVHQAVNINTFPISATAEELKQLRAHAQLNMSGKVWKGYFDKEVYKWNIWSAQ